jgi:hypothetical protein
MATPKAPELQFACRLDVAIAPPREIGEIGWGYRRIIDIIGGRVAGPKLNGRIQPGGADFQLIRPGGLTELHARYALELDDGALVYVENTGLRFGPAAELEKIRRGEAADHSQIYFRSAPRFETAKPDHRWLMEHLFVASGVRRPDGVEITVFQVL